MGIQLITNVNQWAYVYDRITVTGVAFQATSTTANVVIYWHINAAGDIRTTSGTGGYVQVSIFGSLLNSNGGQLTTTHWATAMYEPANADGSQTHMTVNTYSYVEFSYSGLTIGNTYKFCTGFMGEIYFPSNSVSKTANVNVDSSNSYLYCEMD
jgi:hypothetical protein